MAVLQSRSVSLHGSDCLEGGKFHCLRDNIQPHGNKTLKKFLHFLQSGLCKIVNKTASDTNLYDLWCQVEQIKIQTLNLNFSSTFIFLIDHITFNVWGITYLKIT